MSHRGHHASSAGTSAHAGEDWRTRAACRDMDTELFFPVNTSRQAAEPALAVCRDCPVQQTCLSEELARGGLQWGIRGGATEDERRAMLRQKTGKPPAVNACGVCGTGLRGRPRRAGAFEPRYCSETCRTEAKRQQRAAQRRRKREVAA